MNFVSSEKQLFYNIKEVSRAKVDYLKFRISQSNWKRMETVFAEKLSFSHCVGAADVNILRLLVVECDSNITIIKE